MACQAPVPKTENAAAISVRKATLADLPLLMQWRERVIREVFDVPADEDISVLLATNRRYYERAIPAGSHIACFADIEGRAVGCGAICLQDELPSPDNPTGVNAYLMNVFTDPAWRGRGVGCAVVTWLIEQARAHHAGKIYLEATQVGESFYRHHGFVPLEYYFHWNEDFSNPPSKRIAESCYE